MKQLSNIFILLAVLLFSTVSCIKEEMKEDFGGTAGLPVSLKLDTRSLGAGDATINTVRVIVARQQGDGEIITNQFVPSPASPIVLQTMTGLYKVCVIINETEDGKELSELEKGTLLNLSALDNIRLPFNLKGRSMTNIPMFGEKKDVGIVAVDNDSNADIYIGGVNQGKTLEMKVDRLAAKARLVFRSKGLGTLQSVKLSNLPDAVSITGTVYEPTPTAIQQVELQASAFTATVPTPDGLTWEMTTGEEILLPYSSFSPVTDAGKAAILEVVVSNRTMTKALGHIMETNSNPKDYTLHRNTAYTFIGSIGSDNLNVNVEIANWTPVNQDYPAGGGSFWMAEPQSVRVGLDGTLAEKTATFTAKMSTKAGLVYKWYRKRQLNDMSYVIEELVSGMNGVTITFVDTDKSSELVIVASKLEDSGEIHCVGITTSPNGRTETLESGRATLMVVGTEIDNAGTYPDMQNWTPPRNALLGATCLLRDHRTDMPANDPNNDKVYRVKLMADGNWWMIQDLAYGKAVNEGLFSANAEKKEPTDLIGSGLYGVCMLSAEPTGGYLYNTYAAIQLPQGTADDHINQVALDMEFIQGLCPDGWHLPGNMNKSLNKEWVNLQTVLNADVTIPDEWMKYGYDNALHFNAYNLIETESDSGEFVDAIAFHGGYGSGMVNRKLTFCSLGFVTTNYEKGAVLDIGMSIPDYSGVPIRCVRNFKN